MVDWLQLALTLNLEDIKLPVADSEAFSYTWLCTLPFYAHIYQPVKPQKYKPLPNFLGTILNSRKIWQETSLVD